MGRFQISCTDEGFPAFRHYCHAHTTLQRLYRGWSTSAASERLEHLTLIPTSGVLVQEALSWAQNEGVKEPALQKQIQAVLKSLSVPHAGCTPLLTREPCTVSACQIAIAPLGRLTVLAVPSAVFVAKNGRSERLPGAFLGSLHAAAIAVSYQDGIRQTLRAGGASCGRAHLVSGGLQLLGSSSIVAETEQMLSMA